MTSQVAPSQTGSKLKWPTLAAVFEHLMKKLFVVDLVLPYKIEHVK